MKMFRCNGLSCSIVIPRLCQEFIGTLKHLLLTKKSNCSDEGLQLAMAAAEMIVRLELNKRWPQHCGKMADWFDEITVVAVASVSSTEMER